ncbi:MAG: hypothetical protein NC428_11430, partial [Clostridium sp.]|nr:hypothetical protein [Clostridium sp.]
MRKFKKVLASGVVMLLLAGSITACGSDDTNTEQASLNVTTEAVTENETAETENGTAVATSEKTSANTVVVGMALGKEAKTTLETTDMVALAEQKEENKTDASNNTTPTTENNVVASTNQGNTQGTPQNTTQSGGGSYGSWGILILPDDEVTPSG